MPSEYVKSKGWDFRTKKDQLNLRVCPLCGAGGWHFFMGDSGGGPWDCKKCQGKGNLYQLKKHLGDIEDSIHPATRKLTFKKPDPKIVAEYNRALFSDYEALRYLDSRGITQETARHFRLGVRQDEKSRWLCIPWFRGDECMNFKYRSLPPADKDFRREDGCQSILFNENAISQSETIILTEGELDAITLWQHGFKSVVSVTNGAGSFDANWVDRLSRVKKIYICYDSDEQGQKGAVDIAKRLGYNRCLNIVLPQKDTNDFMLNHTAEDFQKFIASAKRFSLPGIITSLEAIELMQQGFTETKEQGGILTPWDNVNRLVGGWKPGDLVVVTALPKTGKTTWCLEITRALIKSGVPSLFFCLEMRPERLMRKICQAEYRIENPALTDLQDARVVYQDKPLYFGYSYKFRNPEELIANIREAISRFGLQFIVFDNLHMLCRNERVNEQLSQTILSFKLLAEEAEIPVVVIAQPRKRENGSTEIMNAEDVKYSSSIHSDCDQMIILHRNRTVTKAKDIGKQEMTLKTESMEPIMMVRVEAHRYGPGGETVLYYHGGLSRFDRVAPRETMSVSGKDRSYA